MEIQNSHKRNLSYQISNVWSKLINIIKHPRALLLLTLSIRRTLLYRHIYNKLLNLLTLVIHKLYLPSLIIS